ncbi:MAG TPA: hypothetical protein VGN15_07565 [Ktedonobacteraceae bacterium]|nr:hypothetical protein [Ktedonobacteraceae bacterium]
MRSPHEPSKLTGSVNDCCEGNAGFQGDREGRPYHIRKTNITGIVV